MICQLVLDNWLPVRTNQWYGRHWRIRHKLLKDQSAILAAEAFVQDVPKAQGKRKISLEVQGWPKGRLPDPDAFDKLLLDAMVKAGLLIDDSLDGICGRVQVTISRSTSKKTIITLEDCPS